MIKNIMRYYNIERRHLELHPHLRDLLWPDTDCGVWCQNQIHGFYGVPETHPNILFIVALAEDGVWFEATYTTTAPAVVQILI